jgi:hypothetical protein
MAFGGGLYLDVRVFRCCVGFCGVQPWFCAGGDKGSTCKWSSSVERSSGRLGCSQNAPGAGRLPWPISHTWAVVHVAQARGRGVAERV